MAQGMEPLGHRDTLLTNVVYCGIVALIPFGWWWTEVFRVLGACAMLWFWLQYGTNR